MGGRAGGGAKARGHSGVGDSPGPRHLAGPAQVREAIPLEERPPYGAALCSTYYCVEGERRIQRSPAAVRPRESRPRRDRQGLQIRSLLRMQWKEQPEIQRGIWRGAVLGHYERSDEKAICTKILHTTVARGAIAKSGAYGRVWAPPALGMFREVHECGAVRIPETPARRGNRDARDPERPIQTPAH